ncbi:glycosyltransferase family 2 protein [Peribacillus simplex]|uniref:glycosyltransferase family 2 protein n=1 Tax=Peribacillus simplex TaxID=1478 RepID=UPI0024C1D0D3|nr:glycosyltransferase family 2 protein [Peribacillus simplex]WHY97946.1 glycosyltransferase family 2 protein [Peribacillus simplex]
MLKVSCILTSYNRPVGVVEAIASVQAQTYQNWELIIVDDNSDKVTQSSLDNIVKKDKRCKLIQSGVKHEDRLKTTRYATCINLAIPYLTGDLVTYLTDDDIYYPQRFEKMVEVFNSNPAIHVVYGRQKVVSLNDGVVMSHVVRPLVGITRSPEGLVDHNSFMHRRSCLDLVKGWDEDPDLWAFGDGFFFKRLVQYWDFYPLDFITDEHRAHEHGVQSRITRGEKPWQKCNDLRFSLAIQLSKLVEQIIESPPDITGWLDFVKVEGNKIIANGWARDPFTGNPGEEVIIANQRGKILAYTRVTQSRPDVAANLQDGRMLQSGWSVTFEKNLLPQGSNSLLAYVLIRKEKKAMRLLGEFNVVN